MALINLLPPAIKDEQRYARHNRSLIDLGVRLTFAGLLMAAILVFQLLLLGGSLSGARASLSGAQAQIAHYAELEASAKAASARLSTLTNLQAAHPHWEDLFGQLALLQPSGVYLTSVNSGPGGSALTVTGSARDESTVASFIKALRGWSALSDVSLQSVSPDSDAVGFAKNSFTLTATLNPAGLK